MINKKKILYSIFGCICSLSCALGLIFAHFEVNTSLNILPPLYSVVYYPPHITGTYLSGPVYGEITGDSIRTNMSTGIFHNGTYSFDFRRGTGPFTTGAGYSSGNTRTHMQTTTIIDWIDNIFPTFTGVTNGMTYTLPVTITFSDTLPGVTAILNGVPFANGTTISTNGVYELMVTDAAGNQTGAIFTIIISETPLKKLSEGGDTMLIKDIKNDCPAGNFSPSYYDKPCALAVSHAEIFSGIHAGTRALFIQMCTKRNCNNAYYTKICGPCSPKVHTSFTGQIHYTMPTQPSIFESPFPKEWNDAYLRAYHLGIISSPNIKDANLTGVLYRKIAAKMASEFAMDVIGLTPDINRKCTFQDIKKEIPELQYYIKLSCQLGIMGLDYYGDPVTIFNPDYIVTRDQFVTILSRILFRDAFNIKHEEYTFFDKVRNFAVHTLTNATHTLGLNIKINTPFDWYTKHLEAIKTLGIMTNYTITTKESRIYVLLIMHKIDQIGLKTIQELVK